MITYIALLRSINVGGKNIIKMADLKQYLTTIGLNNVQTYIQSGNVLFKSGKDEKVLQEELEQGICKEFGFYVPVVLRTSEEMEQIMTHCPYTKEEIEIAKANTEAEVFYCAFLKNPILETELKCLSDAKIEAESFKVIGKNIYLLFNDSIRFSKLAIALQKMQSVNTIRNWNTVCKLLSLSNAI